MRQRPPSLEEASPEALAEVRRRAADDAGDIRKNGVRSCRRTRNPHCSRRQRNRAVIRANSEPVIHTDTNQAKCEIAGKLSVVCGIEQINSGQ